MYDGNIGWVNNDKLFSYLYNPNCIGSEEQNLLLLNKLQKKELKKFRLILNFLYCLFI